VKSPALPRGPRIFASLAVLSLAATFLAAQIDFARRNHIGISAERYWWPQLLQIWLPGIGITVVLAVVSFILHRRGPRA
jgi:hypothetical protein